MRKKMIPILLIATLALSLLAGCGGEQNTTDDPNAESAQPEIITVGTLEQNIVEEGARKEWLSNLDRSGNNNREYVPFSSLNAMLMEFNAGRVDSLRLPESVCRYLASTDDELQYAKRKGTICYHMATRIEDTALCDELSAAIGEIKADGTMETLINDYIANVNAAPEINQLVHHEGAETHIVAVTGDLPPLDYVAADGTPAGFNIALLNAISEKTGCNYEIIQMDANARLAALTSEKADMIFWIGCMSVEGYEPEEESVNLTEPYFEDAVCYAAYSEEFLPSASNGQPAQ